MLATFRSQSATSQITGGDPVVNVPAGVQDGDLMLAYGICAAGGTISAPAGWSTSPASFGGQGPLFTRIASSEPASYTFPISGIANGVVCIVAYKDVLAIDAAANVAGATGVITLPSINSAGANRRLVQLVAKLGSTTFTPPGTASERFDAAPAPAGFTIAGGDEVVGSGATGTRAWTPAAGAQGSIGYIIALVGVPPEEGQFSGAYDLAGSGFIGAAGPGAGQFAGGYDLAGSGFIGVAPTDIPSGQFSGIYSLVGSGFTGQAPVPPPPSNRPPVTAGGRLRFTGRRRRG